jgi:hypothetical protein
MIVHTRCTCSKTGQTGGRPPTIHCSGLVASRRTGQVEADVTRYPQRSALFKDKQLTTLAPCGSLPRMATRRTLGLDGSVPLQESKECVVTRHGQAIRQKPTIRAPALLDTDLPFQ